MKFDFLHQTLIKSEHPILLIQGFSEIKIRGVDYIFIMIKSEKKRKRWLKNSGHPIFKSQDHQRFFSDLSTFVSEICN